MSPENAWRGFTHQQLYDMVRSGPGPEVVVTAEAAWAHFATTMASVEERLNRAVRNVGAGWEGQAADAMTTATTPLGEWAFDTAEKGRQAAAALRIQSDIAAHTRNEMPVPAPPGAAPPAGTFPGNDPALRQAQDDLRARELMLYYSWNVHDTFGVMVDWADPPVAVLGSGTGVGPAGGPDRALSAGPLGDAGVGAAGTGGGGPGTAGLPGTGTAGPGAAGTGIGGPGAGGQGAGGQGAGGQGAGVLPGPLAPGGRAGTTPGGAAGRPGVDGRSGPATAGSPTGGGTGRSGSTGTPPGVTSPGGAARPGTAAGATARSPFDPADPRTRFLPTSRPGSTPAPPPAPTNWRDLVRANGGFAEPTGSGRPPVVEQAPRGSGPAATPAAAPVTPRAGTTTGGHPGMLPMVGSGAGQGGETRRRAPYLIDDVGIFDVERDLPHHVPPILLPPDHPDYR